MLALNSFVRRAASGAISPSAAVALARAYADQRCVELAQAQVEEMKAQVVIAKESKNIDAAVNLAATTKRLLALIADGEKLVA